jgi:hypothetical protein
VREVKGLPGSGDIFFGSRRLQPAQNQSTGGTPVPLILKIILLVPSILPKLSALFHKFGNVFINGKRKVIYFPLTPALSPIGGEGRNKYLLHCSLSPRRGERAGVRGGPTGNAAIIYPVLSYKEGSPSPTPPFLVKSDG